MPLAGGGWAAQLARETGGWGLLTRIRALNTVLSPSDALTPVVHRPVPGIMLFTAFPAHLALHYRDSDESRSGYWEVPIMDSMIIIIICINHITN